MENYTHRFLYRIEEMLPYYDLVVQLGYSFTASEYPRLLNEMIPQGYRQVVILEGEKAIGLSGIWINTKLFSGKYAELDNVIVDPAYRNKGVGHLLCQLVEAHAREQNCRIAVLDAYVENFAAHRFYYREGYIARGSHFLKKL